MFKEKFPTLLLPGIVKILKSNAVYSRTTAVKRRLKNIRINNRKHKKTVKLVAVSGIKMRNKSKSRKDSRVAGARSYPDVRLVPAKRKGKCLVPLFRTKSFFLLLSDGIELEKKEKKKLLFAKVIKKRWMLRNRISLIFIWNLICVCIKDKFKKFNILNTIFLKYQFYKMYYFNNLKIFYQSISFLPLPSTPHPAICRFYIFLINLAWFFCVKM